MDEAQRGKNRSAVMAGLCILGTIVSIYFDDQDIQQVISNIKPLPGALEFTKWLRDISRFVIVSDTFQEFAKPLMKQLDDPFILCHSLEIAKDGRITNYKLRQSDPKRRTVEAFQSMNFKVIAFGDSYNDV